MADVERLVLVSTKCSRPEAHDEWADWHDDTHLPWLLADGDTATWATRHQLCTQPVPGQPSLGWTHLTLFGIHGDDADKRTAELLDRVENAHPSGHGHPNHAVIQVDVVEPHGRWRSKDAPADGLTGHILAWVLPADPREHADWDAWYDATHVPDMLATDAFRSMSRWRRVEPSRFGANDLTLYDVGLDPVTEAVDRSAAALPPLIAAGRKHRSHTGALAVPVEVSGRHGGRGYWIPDRTG